MRLFDKLNEITEYTLAGDPISIEKEDEKKLGDILFQDGKPLPYTEFIKRLSGQDPNGVKSGEELVGRVDNKVFAILNMGKDDLDIQDEMVDIKSVNTPVKSLFPTQAQIGLLDSLAFCAFKLPAAAKSYLSGNADFGGGKVISCDINGTKYILDGHHRWSGVYAMNPDATVPCFELQLTGKVKDPIHALKVIQLAIAATYQAVLLKGANSETDIFNPAVVAGNMVNLINRSFNGDFGYTKVDESKALENLKQFIELLAADKIYSENVKTFDFSKFEKLSTVFDTEELKQKYSNVVTVLAKNLDLLNSENGKPGSEIKRAAMPQPNDTSKTLGFGEDPEGLPDDVMDKIESGELNFLPSKDGSFVPSDNTDKIKSKLGLESKKWIKTYEQFRNQK